MHIKFLSDLPQDDTIIQAFKDQFKGATVSWDKCNIIPEKMTVEYGGNPDLVQAIELLCRHLGAQPQHFHPNKTWGSHDLDIYFKFTQDLLNKHKVGSSCIVCNTINEYVAYQKDFVCYKCKLDKQLSDEIRSILNP